MRLSHHSWRNSVCNRRLAVCGVRHSDDQLTVHDRQGACGYDQADIRRPSKQGDCMFDLASVTNVDGSHLHPERGRSRLDHGELSDASCDIRIPNDRCLGDARCYLFQQLQPFCAQAVLEREKPRRVSTGLRETIHVTSPNWIDDIVEYNWNGSRSSQKSREHRCAGCYQNIGRKRKELLCLALDFRRVAAAPSHFDVNVSTFDARLTVRRRSTSARRSSSTSTLEDVGGVDLVFDLIGGDIQKRSAGLIRAGGTLVSIVGPAEARPTNGLAIDFVVETDRAQLGEIVQRVRDGRLRTNIGNIATLDDAVAALNPTERRKGKTIIHVRP